MGSVQKLCVEKGDVSLFERRNILCIDRNGETMITFVLNQEEKKQIAAEILSGLCTEDLRKNKNISGTASYFRQIYDER